MGATVSVSNDDVHCSAINEAKTFFSNKAIIHKFWEEVAHSSPTASLMDILGLLSSTDYGNIVIYSSPFLGPFATSRFCLRQAYYTATARLGDTNLTEMKITEDELLSFLKHLFFFHRIYALFDQTFEFDTVLTLSRYIEILEDFNDRDLRKDNLEGKFTALCDEHGGEVKYVTFVKHLADTIFSTNYMFPSDICDALIEKSSDEIKENEAIIKRDSSANPMSLREINIDTESVLLNVSWYSVRGKGCDSWLQMIESLGNNYFRSLLNQVKCEKCCFCESFDDPNTFITFMWLRPEGEVLYEAFIREQLNDGGLFQTAIAEGSITSEIQELQAMSGATDWRKRIVRTDVMSLVHFEVQDVTGFVNNYSRHGSGSVQESIGKCSPSKPGIEGALVAHYDQEGWQMGGPRYASDCEKLLSQGNPMDSSGLFCKRTLRGTVIASFDKGKWL